MRSVELQVAIWKEDNNYVSQCLNVDVSSFGKTKAQALKNLKEALELYFEDSVSVKKNPLSEVKNPELTNLSLQYA